MVITEQDIQELAHGVSAGEVRRCVRCIMPENYPGVTFDAEGVCNFCRVFEKQWGSWMASR